MSWTETDIEFPAADGVIVPATLVEPGQVEHICLFLHGITGSRDGFMGFQREAAHHLAALNVASLRIDFRGHGDSLVPDIDFSPIGQIMDAKAACRWLLRRYPGHDLALIGASFGALPAVFVSLDMPEVTRLALFTPVLDYRRTYFEPAEPGGEPRYPAAALRQAEIDGFVPYGDGKTFRRGIRQIEEMRRLDPLAALRDTKATITVIHGDRDPTVPFAISAEIAAADPRIRFHAIANMQHSWRDADDPEGPRSDENKRRIFDIYADVVRG